MFGEEGDTILDCKVNSAWETQERGDLLYIQIGVGQSEFYAERSGVDETTGWSARSAPAKRLCTALLLGPTEVPTGYGITVLTICTGLCGEI